MAADPPLKPTHTVFLGLGGNLGDRAAALDAALAGLAGLVVVDAVSPVYETDPMGYRSQPAFLNQVVRARTGLAPRALLRGLKALEHALGRPRRDPIRFGPRVIDLDLLLYDDRVVDEPPAGDGLALRVPHPRLAERAFVLVPLADLAPDLVHPELGATIAALRARVDDAGVRRATPRSPRGRG